MVKSTLLEEEEHYVSNLFLNADTSGLFYHDFNHTLSVVEAVTKITQVLQLSTSDSEVLILSAWFHDVGYLFTRTEHEAQSIEIVKYALNPNYSHLLDAVTICIAATKVGETPKNELAALLKDADIAFGSAYDFFKTNHSYREELRISEEKTFDDATWRQMCIDFLKGVQFYSDYGKKHFEQLVKKNLETYLNSN